jgi:tetratricopeptide (TPR) repeat protein
MREYDAFISYSHAGDKAIATALQSVIQSLGRSWYQRRALRVFRDDTSLSASPHLWSSIEQALKDSRFLILFASPEAASSRWVTREIEYWLATKGLDTLLIALTKGELLWDVAARDFKYSDSPPLPLVLRGKFSDEPRWIDLRSHRDRVSGRDAKFIELAANFAAQVRGIAKEDLLSQEIKQQRRALTLAWSAVVSVLLLAGAAVWQWNSATVQRDRAENTLAAATQTTNGLVYDLAQEFRHKTGMPIGFVRRILDRAQDLQKTLAESGQTTRALRLSEASALKELVLVFLAQGDTNAAIAAADRSHAIIQSLVPDGPNVDPDAKWVLVNSYKTMGQALAAGGRREAALEASRQGVAIARTLVERKPNDPNELDLAVLHQVIGDVLLASEKRKEGLDEYRISATIFETMVVADPNDASSQFGLSITHQRIGDALYDDDDIEGALLAYRKGLEFGQKIAAADPDNTRWQQNLAESYDRIADVFAKTRRWKDAVETLEKSVAIRQKLADDDSGNAYWQIGLSLNYQKFGEALAANNNFHKALGAYNVALAIREKLSSKDPNNLEWQRALAVTYDDMGDALHAAGNSNEAVEQYRRALPVWEKLIKSDVDNPKWRRELSTNHQHTAEALVKLKEYDKALEEQNQSLAIFRELANAQPNDSSLQRDLANSYVIVGKTLETVGRYDQAVEAFGKASAILERLVTGNTENGQWKLDLAVNSENIGRALVASGHQAEALKAYYAASPLLEELTARDPRNVNWLWRQAANTDNIGDILVAMHRSDEGIAAYRNGSVLWESLTREDDGLRSRHELVINYLKLASALAATERSEEARDWYRKGLDIVEELAAQHPENEVLQSNMIVILRDLARNGDKPRQRLTRALAIARQLQAAGKLDPSDLVERLERELRKIPRRDPL